MILELLRWWYGDGFARARRTIFSWPSRALHEFSVPLLLRTLFAPWKRIISGGGRTLDAKIQAMVDNLVSRVIGFCVRILVLIAAGLMSLAAIVAAVVTAVAWPLVPVFIIYLVVRGITG